MRRLAVTLAVLALTLGGCEKWQADPTIGPPGAFVEAGSFVETGPLTYPRTRHTATLLADGRVLVVGGCGDCASAEAWDPATGSFSPAGSLAEARTLHTATPLLDGRVLVAGGRGSDGDRLASAEVWDPATGSFGPAGSLTEARYGHTATALLDGRVLIVGDRDDYPVLDRAEVWDPATASFGPAGRLAKGREKHTATLLCDGRVLVIGGSSVAESYIKSAEVWDPATASFRPAGSLVWRRTDHTATLLSDGRVLLMGGTWRPAEIWDPATASSAQASSLAGAGYGGHTSTLLPDGRVLVIGGGPGNKHATVWNPSDAIASSRGRPSPTDPRQNAMSGRIERPAEGYAITFPGCWEVRDLTDELHQVRYGEPPSDDQTPYLYAEHPGSEADCALYDFAEYTAEPPAFRDVEEATDDWVFGGDAVGFLETAAGRVGRVTGIEENGWVSEMYVYQQADRWVYLECWAPGPEEDFAVIGESFEFLPTEG